MHTVTPTNGVRQLPQMSNGRDGLEGARSFPGDRCLWAERKRILLSGDVTSVCFLISVLSWTCAPRK